MKNNNILEKTRVYLSGPMDFVGSRVIEKYLGWRSIITPIFKALSIRVLDPWNKPKIRGHRDYGIEGILPNKSEYEKDFWKNPKSRAKYSEDFWETVHIDLRMTDLADFVVAFVPTNIYSVGTVHEIVVAREQHKPVLLISPPISYSNFKEIDSLSDDTKDKLKFYGLKENPEGLPSQWYGNIVGGQNLFDGFGWENLDFKDKNFYPNLFDNILEITKPDESTSQEDIALWNRMNDWITHIKGIIDLKGGVMDHISFPNDHERELFEKALQNEQEKERKYFWYNKPYVPKRPMLYHFLLIASGYIPPKLKISSKIDDDGNVQPVTYTAHDDNWLLISPEA